MSVCFIPCPVLIALCKIFSNRFWWVDTWEDGTDILISYFIIFSNISALPIYKRFIRHSCFQLYLGKLCFGGSDILYNRLNMRFLKYWNIIHTYECFLEKYKVSINEYKEDKKWNIWGYEVSEVPNRRWGMSKWKITQRIIPSIIC